MRRSSRRRGTRRVVSSRGGLCCTRATPASFRDRRDLRKGDGGGCEGAHGIWSYLVIRQVGTHVLARRGHATG